MKKQVKQTDDKKINIPNNIHFYSDICGLLLQINDDQLLFESDKRYWLANLLMYLNDEVKCKLELCKFDDLKEGDFFVDDIKSINHVNYPLPKGEVASEVSTPTNVGSSFRFFTLRSTE